ncbi:MAG: sigma-54 dependent transcriptional regulator [Candidatus Eisenbacteria bacterium]
MPQGNVLLVDDERSIRETLKAILEAEGHSVTTAGSGEEGLRAFRERDPDLVLLDLGLPDIPGLDVLERMRNIRSDAAVVIVTAQTDVRSAVEAMKRGAADFLPKPVDAEHLGLVVRRALRRERDALELDHLRKTRAREYGIDFVMSESGRMQELLGIVRLVAESDSTSVLIEGESGTGKELVAHILHNLSARAPGPFLDINCASLPEELLESELFGHEKGAYTDAHQMKKGLLELADGGTLFLDEVGEMSLTIQVKLLRVLEKMTFRRVGGVKDIRVSVRIVSATNRDLITEVREGRFREDLYYRLKVVPLTLPPLRERPEDVPLLAMHFVKTFNVQFRRSFRGFTPGASERLLRYPWPGNIREMRNVLERTILLARNGDWIDTEILQLPAGTGDAGMAPVEVLAEALRGRVGEEGIDLEVTLQEIEKELILRFSEKAGWNQTLTSRLLGMNRDKLRYRMKLYDIQRPEPAHSSA